MKNNKELYRSALMSGLSKKEYTFPKEKEPEVVEKSSYAPTFSLTDKQIPVIKGKAVGDVCAFKISAKLTGIDENRKGMNYRFEMTKVEYKDSEDKEEEKSKRPMESAYRKAEKVKYVRLDQQPLSGGW